MNLINLPDEILIIIIQFMYTSRVHYELVIICNLISICKRFDFLRKKSYLVKIIDFFHHKSLNAFTSVNYLGQCTGPQYFTILGIFYGYIDDEIVVSCYNNYDTEHYICIGEYQYDNIATEIYENICQQLCENLEKDQEVFDFIHERSRKLCLIRPKFPKLVLDPLQLHKISEMYVAKKINKHKINTNFKFDND